MCEYNMDKELLNLYKKWEVPRNELLSLIMKQPSINNFKSTEYFMNVENYNFYYLYKERKLFKICEFIYNKDADLLTIRNKERDSAGFAVKYLLFPKDSYIFLNFGSRII